MQEFEPNCLKKSQIFKYAHQQTPPLFLIFFPLVSCRLMMVRHLPVSRIQNVELLFF